MQDVSHACKMSLFTEKYIFLLAFSVDSYLFAPKKEWNIKKMDTNASLRSFSIIFWYQKNIFLSLLLRFFSFSEQCRNLNFYVQGVLVLKIIFLILNSVYSHLIVLRKKENIIKTMIIAFPLSFQTILWPLQIVSDFISFWYPVFSYLKQQQSKNNLLVPCKTSLMHLEWIFLRKNTFFS